jgi:Domain of unknown function (DUF4926)
MIHELKTVILTTDLPDHSLKAGDLGTVVLVREHSGCEVEFMTLGGETVAVVSLSPDQVRPVGHWEMAHARLVTME